LDPSVHAIPNAPHDTVHLHAKTRLIPVTLWQREHHWPPAGGLRHLIFNAKQNGFDAVIRRVGRRVLIDESAFFAWVAAQGGKK
jgi:hypothetical protein